MLSLPKKMCFFYAHVEFCTWKKNVRHVLLIPFHQKKDVVESYCLLIETTIQVDGFNVIDSECPDDFQNLKTNDYKNYWMMTQLPEILQVSQETITIRIRGKDQNHWISLTQIESTKNSRNKLCIYLVHHKDHFVVIFSNYQSFTWTKCTQKIMNIQIFEISTFHY